MNKRKKPPLSEGTIKLLISIPYTYLKEQEISDLETYLDFASGKTLKSLPDYAEVETRHMRATLAKYSALSTACMFKLFACGVVIVGQNDTLGAIEHIAEQNYSYKGNTVDSRERAAYRRLCATRPHAVYGHALSKLHPEKSSDEKLIDFLKDEVTDMLMHKDPATKAQARIVLGSKRSAWTDHIIKHAQEERRKGAEQSMAALREASHAK